MINSEIYYNHLQKKYTRSITLGTSRIKKALTLINDPHEKFKTIIKLLLNKNSEVNSSQNEQTSKINIQT